VQLTNVVNVVVWSEGAEDLRPFRNAPGTDGPSGDLAPLVVTEAKIHGEKVVPWHPQLAVDQAAHRHGFCRRLSGNRRKVPPSFYV
jgi:hypothetical protein